MIRGRKVSPVEVAKSYLRRIDEVNPKLNAIVAVSPDVLARAREAEAAVMRGDEVGPLHGVPVTVKDTIETKGLKTTAGSLLRATHLPTEDAPAVAKLKLSGAILLGKTNVPEMAIPYECDNPVFGRTNNPHDVSKTSGGSSGGEAASISACISPFGLGSDLSGSIRVPAHFCGIVGLKPTAGRISAENHFPPAVGPLSLGAVIGPMARRVEDLSLLLNVLTHVKAADSLSEPAPGAEIHGLRVAIYLDEASAPVTRETRQAIEAALQALLDAGLVLTEEKPPGFDRAIDLWPALFSQASLFQLRAAYAGREDLAGKVVRKVLASSESGSALSLEAFFDAWTERDHLRAAFISWMLTTPLIIAPVGSRPAFEHGARRVETNGQTISVFRAFGYARAANVLGLPSISIPAGRSSEGLPIGVQLIGAPFREEMLLAAASIIEDALGGWVQPEESKDKT